MAPLTWQPFGPFDHFDQLPLAQLIQAGEQGGSRVWLAVVVSCIHHFWLDGLQDVDEDHLGVEARTRFRGGILDGLEMFLC